MPDFANGKICYIQIPAMDIEQSASFYSKAFGWKTRQRGDGELAFDDGVDQVSGVWVTNRKPMTEIGLLIYIMVEDINATVEKITGAGGQIILSPDMNAENVIAHFRDPAGNIFGVFQEPTLQKK